MCIKVNEKSHFISILALNVLRKQELCSAFSQSTLLTPSVNQTLTGKISLVEDIKLFKLLPAKLYIYRHISSTAHPYAKVVKLSNDDKQSSRGGLLPQFKVSPRMSFCWKTLNLGVVKLPLTSNSPQTYT